MYTCSAYVGYATKFSWSVGEKKRAKGARSDLARLPLRGLFGSELVSMLVSDGKEREKKERHVKNFSAFYSSNIRAVDKQKKAKTCSFRLLSFPEQIASGGQTTTRHLPSPPWTFLLSQRYTLLGTMTSFRFSLLSSAKRARKEAGHDRRLGPLACSAPASCPRKARATVPSKRIAASFILFPPAP